VPDFNLKLVFEVLDRATAPMRRIGEAVGRIGKATGLDKVAQATGAVGVGLAAVGREAIRFGGLVAGGVTAAGGALFALVKRSAGAADELAKTADKLGVGIAALQRLEYHAGLSGVATGQLRDSVRFLLNAAGEAAQGIGAAGDTFARLGIQVTDNTGKLKSAETLMYEIADAIAKVEDPTLRVSIAQDLFGRSGAGMINMLKGGAESMLAAGREAGATERDPALDELDRWVMGPPAVGIPALVACGELDRWAPCEEAWRARDALGGTAVFRKFGYMNWDGMDFGHLDLALTPEARKAVFPVVAKFLKTGDL